MTGGVVGDMTRGVDGEMSGDGGREMPVGGGRGSEVDVSHATGRLCCQALDMVRHPRLVDIASVTAVVDGDTGSGEGRGCAMGRERRRSRSRDRAMRLSSFESHDGTGVAANDDVSTSSDGCGYFPKNTCIGRVKMSSFFVSVNLRMERFV